MITVNYFFSFMEALSVGMQVGVGYHHTCQNFGDVERYHLGYCNGFHVQVITP